MGRTRSSGKLRADSGEDGQLPERSDAGVQEGLLIRTTSVHTRSVKIIISHRGLEAHGSQGEASHGICMAAQAATAWTRTGTEVFLGLKPSQGPRK